MKPPDLMATMMDEDILLNKLNPVKTAFHTAEGAARTCHEGTRVEVLAQVKRWFQDPDLPSILWLSGVAGTGKTTIAQSNLPTPQATSRCIFPLFT